MRMTATPAQRGQTSCQRICASWHASGRLMMHRPRLDRRAKSVFRRRAFTIHPNKLLSFLMVLVPTCSACKRAQTCCHGTSRQPHTTSHAGHTLLRHQQFASKSNVSWFWRALQISEARSPAFCAPSATRGEVSTTIWHACLRHPESF